MADDDPNALVFALCHEAGSLLTALRFHAAAATDASGDAALRSVTTQLGTRIGALLALVRPLLEGPRDEAAVAGWRNHPEHRLAQAAGRGGLFADYRLRVVSVIRDYGPQNRDDAPPDALGDALD